MILPSRLSTVFNFLILCFVERSSFTQSTTSDKYYMEYWIDTDSDNTLYVESWAIKQDFHGVLTVMKNDDQLKVYTIKIHEDIVDMKTLTVGPAWDQRMSVSVLGHGHGCQLIVVGLTCADNRTDLYSLWTNGYSKRLVRTIMFTSLAPSSPRMTNPDGVQLKEEHTYMFLCTASTAESEKKSSLHWHVTRGEQGYVLSEYSSAVNSTHESEGKPACIKSINSTLTLKIEPEDQDMLLNCLLTNPDYNTLEQADSANSCLTNQWCNATPFAFSVVCYGAGSWKMEHCVVQAGYMYWLEKIIPLAFLILFILLLGLLGSQKSIKGELAEEAQQSGLSGKNDIEITSGPITYTGPQVKINVPVAMNIGFQWGGQPPTMDSDEESASNPVARTEPRDTSNGHKCRNIEKPLSTTSLLTTKSPSVSRDQSLVDSETENDGTETDGSTVFGASGETSSSLDDNAGCSQSSSSGENENT